MGDRTNLVISYKSVEGVENLGQALPGSLVLYSHSYGYNMGPLLANGLNAAQGRWGDDSYAARIIVSQIIGEEWRKSIGFGLYVGQLGDNERTILLVDMERQKVVRFGEPGKHLSLMVAEEAKPTGEWSFAEFSTMTEKEARYSHIRQ